MEDTRLEFGEATRRDQKGVDRHVWSWASNTTTLTNTHNKLPQPQQTRRRRALTTEKNIRALSPHPISKRTTCARKQTTMKSYSFGAVNGIEMGTYSLSKSNGTLRSNTRRKRARTETTGQVQEAKTCREHLFCLIHQNCTLLFASIVDNLQYRRKLTPMRPSWSNTCHPGENAES